MRTFTTVDNKVTKLYNGVNIGGGDNGNIWEGYPINFIRGFKVGGIFQTQAEIDAGGPGITMLQPGNLPQT
jgi:hypothetical protein